MPKPAQKERDGESLNTHSVPFSYTFHKNILEFMLAFFIFVILIIFLITILQKPKDIEVIKIVTNILLFFSGGLIGKVSNKISK